MSIILSLVMNDVRVTIIFVGVLLYSHSAYLQYTVMIHVEGDVGRKILFKSTE